MSRRKQPTYETGTLLAGSCLDLLPTLPEESAHAVITDPPYGLEFMNDGDWERYAPADLRLRSGWDHAAAGANVQTEDKSTPHSRTGVAYHKRRSTYKCSTCGRRDAFRNAHDCPGTWKHEWVDPLPYEQLAFQAWFEDVARQLYRVLKPGGYVAVFGGTRTYHRMVCAIENVGFEIRDTVQWVYKTGFAKNMAVPGGLGTALKPAHEPIVLARKPLDGTVAGNVELHGTGALSIDATRPAGKHPANVVTDQHAAADLGTTSLFNVAEWTPDDFQPWLYVRKPTKAERTAGGAGLHPTTKPVELLRHLVRLLCPPDGTVLDPFLGSGTTAVAAVTEGRRWTGCELNTEYVAVARARIAHAEQQRNAAQPALFDA